MALVRRDNFLGVVAETEWGAIQAGAKLGSMLNPGGPDAGQAKWSAWNGLPAMDKIWETVRDVPGADITKVSQGAVETALAWAARKLAATYRTPFQMNGSIGSVLRHRPCEGRPGDLLVGDPKCRTRLGG